MNPELVKPAVCHCPLRTFKRFDKPLHRISSPPRYSKSMSSVSHRDFKGLSRSVSVKEIGRYANRDPYFFTNAHMATVGLKSRALPLNYSTESKQKLLPWTSKLNKSMDIKPRDHYLFTDQSDKNRKSEYKGKYFHQSLYHNDQDNQPAKGNEFQESVIPIGHVSKLWTKPRRSMETTTIQKQHYRGNSIESYQTEPKRKAIKQLYFLTRNGIPVPPGTGDYSSANTIYKGDYVKPIRNLDFSVPRKYFSQPQKATDRTTSFLQDPIGRAIPRAQEPTTAYNSAFVDHHMVYCDCSVVPSPKVESRFESRRTSEAAAYLKPSLAKQLAVDRRCSFRSIIRPKIVAN